MVVHSTTKILLDIFFGGERCDAVVDWLSFRQTEDYVVGAEILVASLAATGWEIHLLLPLKVSWQ